MSSWLTRSMTYPAPSAPVPDEPPEPLEAVDLEGPEGGRLSAWWLPPPRDDDAAPVALMLHGNGENLETMRRSGLFQRFSELGVGLLALDYPGYGRSAGEPGEASLLAAADVAWRALLERAGNRPRVVIGWSLGAAVAMQVAVDHPDSVHKLVLLSAWTDLAAVARQHFPGFITDLLLADRYDSVEAAPKVACPVLQVHGGDDGIIPVELGRDLHAALEDGAAESVRWVEVRGAGHNDLLGRSEVWAAMERFLG